MSEVTDLIVLMLQKIQHQLGRLELEISNLKEDMHHIKVRMTSMEANLYALNRQGDHTSARLERIERRLDLVEA